MIVYSVYVIIEQEVKLAEWINWDDFSMAVNFKKEENVTVIAGGPEIRWNCYNNDMTQGQSGQTDPHVPVQPYDISLTN